VVARLDIFFVERSDTIKLPELRRAEDGSARQGMKQKMEGVSYVKFQLYVTFEQSFLGAHSKSGAKNFPGSGQV
jgi:hypothetical protein